ncbi:glycosyltransferase family 39 protein [Bradyrhizobium sp. Pear76]|uniref:glycosyltransferase family 39 protein n=1 Tax=Bradyrhizobium oropedii TaxID=1571201 RepID=UPI001E3694FC|nr:glycosyltransferase family 39 protein [Bradyrhizobium oropedii]MCC8967962.1 glycosyltransferase family 39 protein [Bradyrhizobium oropedii]
MTLALDGTAAKPFGNPANYLDPTAEAFKKIPAYWGTLRYNNIVYYGAVMFDIAFPFYATAHLVGLPAFPTAPIILRTISMLAALMSLLFVYNFAKRHAGVVVGVLSCAALLTDGNFIYYMTIIHPDTLQIYFGLLALGLALRHSGDGSLSSLAALGMVCGLVQGTKFGGPWTVPLATAALLMGIRATGAHQWDKKVIAQRVAVLGATALLGWLGTNPYAVITPYYFDSWVAQWQIVGSSGGPLGTFTPWDWMKAIYDYVGPLGSALAVAGLLHGLSGGFSTTRKRALFLAAILSLSQIAYYALLGKLWVVVGYLLVALPLMAMLSFDFVVTWLRFILAKPFGRLARPITLTFVFLATLYLGTDHVFALVNQTLALRHRDNTLLALNDWAAKGGIPPDARIVFDDLGYFDPKIFKNAKMYGGVLTWSGVNALDPEYIVLSSSLYGSPHYAKLIETQHLAADDPNPFSMLMYQALIPTPAPGPTAAEGITFVKEIAPESSRAKASSPAHLTPWRSLEARVRSSLALLEGIWQPIDKPRVGPTLKIYKRKPNKPSDDQH